MSFPAPADGGTWAAAEKASSHLAGDQDGTYLVLASQSRPQSRPAPRPPSRPTSRPPQRKSTASGPSRDQWTQRELVSRSFQHELEYRKRMAAKLIRRIETENAEGRKRTAARKKLKEQYGLAFVEMPRGETLVRHGEILGANLSEESRKIVLKMGFTVMRHTGLGEVGITLDLLRIPDGLSMKEALEALRAADKKSHYDYNMAYAPASDRSENMAASKVGKDNESARPEPQEAVATSLAAAEKRILVGMIDTGVNAGHKLLSHAMLLQGNLGRGPTVTPRDHGTAIASILARGRAARIVVVDVFSGPAAYADAESIVVALEFLAQQGVGVINMSIAGPDSPLLAQAVSNLIAKGYLIVAAVGNEGPAGPIRFPAGHAGVIGVTAVDNSRAIFEMANQGVAVDYAALGVKVKAASVRGQKNYSGTSFAAPIVSAFLADRYQRPDADRAGKLLLLLDGAVTDLGPTGPDLIFGHGFLPN